MSNEFFLDTAYAIALSVESDEHHQLAEELAEQLLANQTPLVTTRAVLLEIGNALSKKRYRQAAGELLDALERDPQVEIVLITEELYKQALSLFCSRLDKEWGLIDCVSFVVMQERGLTSALTTDEHFEQAAHSFDFNEAWSLVGVGSVAAELATSDHLAAVTANRAFGVGDDHAFCKGREVFV